MDVYSPADIYSAREKSLRSAIGRMDTNVLRGVLMDVANVATEPQDPEGALQQSHAIVWDAVRQAGRFRCV